MKRWSLVSGVWSFFLNLNFALTQLKWEALWNGADASPQRGEMFIARKSFLFLGSIGAEQRF
jgi:hypothetical protein